MTFRMLTRKLDELGHLQRILEYFGDNVESTVMESKYHKLESEIAFYDGEIQASLGVENKIYEGLEAFVEWLETIEGVVISVERAESLELFDEAYTCLVVSFFHLLFSIVSCPLLLYFCS